MRPALLFVVMVLLPAALAGAPKRPRESNTARWEHATFGKGAIARVTAGAGVKQLRKKPAKYGGGASGFGKRLGAGMATNVVDKTVEHALAARLHEDLNYHRSNKHGVAPRLAYALKSTVITRNTRNGRRRPGAGRLAGHAAAGVFTQGVLAAGSGASTAGIGVAADAGANVVREFVPRHNRHPHRRQ